MKDRLIELLEDTLHEWECDVQTKTLSQIADHLLSNGVIVPPCKVGDTVYQIDAERVYEFKVTNIIYDTPCIAFDRRAVGNGLIFLTKEEAEEKLKECENNGNL